MFVRQQWLPHLGRSTRTVARIQLALDFHHTNCFRLIVGKSHPVFARDTMNSVLIGAPESHPTFGTTHVRYALDAEASALVEPLYVLNSEEPSLLSDRRVAIENRRQWNDLSIKKTLFWAIVFLGFYKQLCVEATMTVTTITTHGHRMLTDSMQRSQSEEAFCKYLAFFWNALELMTFQEYSTVRKTDSACA